MSIIAVMKSWLRCAALLAALVSLSAASGCTGGGSADEGAKSANPAAPGGTASTSAAPAPGRGSTGAAAEAGGGHTTPGPVRVDPNPAPSPLVAAPPLSPAGAQVPNAMQAAPGTMSLRFIVRRRETGEELPAGGFDVRLLSLDAMREDGAATGSAAAPAAGGASAASGAAGTTYKGKPEQVLVTQLDGAKWTFLAGVRPGTYALRITAPRRKMLLEVITVKTTDRSVERSLEPE